MNLDATPILVANFLDALAGYRFSEEQIPYSGVLSNDVGSPTGFDVERSFF
jgi:hypothetical protein